MSTQIQPQTEPDPAATSISNDTTLNEAPNADATADVPSAPTTSEDAAKAEEKTKTADDDEPEDETAKLAANNEKERSNDNDDRKPRDNDRRGDKRRNDRDDRPRKKQRNNVKSNYENLPESSDADEIRRQVEFYFSDSNLPTDKFLLEKTGGHKNQPVPLKEIHSFKRMQHFQPYSAVFDAVKASTMLNLSDDGNITRKEPLSDKYSTNVNENKNLVMDATMARSIYAKGFGEEQATTQKDVEDFFAVYGDVNSVRLRRKEDGTFKGSVFVEFATEDLAKEFLAQEPKPKWEDKELQIKSKKEYCDEKIDEIREGRTAPRQQYNRGGRNDRRDHGKSGDADNWKERRDGDRRNGKLRYNDRKGGRGDRTCYNCGGEGHISRDCPEPRKNGKGDRREEREVKEEGKKRARDEDGAADGEAEAKKSKTEVETSA